MITNNFHLVSIIFSMSRNNKNNYFSSISEFKFIEGKRIGKGSFGEVRLALHVETSKIYAIKIVPLFLPRLSNMKSTPMSEKEHCKGKSNYMLVLTIHILSDSGRCLLKAIKSIWLWIMSKKATFSIIKTKSEYFLNQKPLCISRKLCQQSSICIQ